MRLGLFALVRLKAYEPLAAAVLDASGRPSGVVAGRVRAAADQRSRAIPALQQLAQTPGPLHARVRRARPRRAARTPRRCRCLRAMLEQAKARRGDLRCRPCARSAQIGAPEAAEPLLALLTAEKTDPNVRLEAVTALGALKRAGGAAARSRIC